MIPSCETRYIVIQMKPKLKSLPAQVIVITGASSGIGLVTARLAARQGATLVLAARDQNVLEELCDEIDPSHDRVLPVATDVSCWEDVKMLGAKALQRFGRFDTWINNAGGSVYGRIRDVPLEDEFKVFATNYWGTVYGCRVATEHLCFHGGAIINIGSVASDLAIPLQAAYSASKHAIKAYTDSLRAEVQKDHLPISVTLIKPAAIDTPFFHHAKSYLDGEPIEPSPMYAPELVARAILRAAQFPLRDIFVGGTAPIASALGRSTPTLGDILLNSIMFSGQTSRRKPHPGDHRVLERASGILSERGSYPGTYVLKRSIYTEVAKRPALKLLIAVAAVLAMAALRTPAGKRSRALPHSPAQSLGFGPYSLEND
jgi:short-subunit dehydrogenase